MVITPEPNVIDIDSLNMLKWSAISDKTFVSYDL